MRARLRSALFCLTALLLLTGCGAETAETPGYTQISQEEAARMMERDEGCVIVDVRQREEYYEAPHSRGSPDPQREHRPGAAGAAAGQGSDHPGLLPQRQQEQAGRPEAGGPGLYAGL